MFNLFLTSNKAQYRLLRTVVQALLGWFINNIAMLIAQTNFSADVQIIIVSVSMTILSALMKALGTDCEALDEEE